jgi:hypothetical protein
MDKSKERSAKQKVRALIRETLSQDIYYHGVGSKGTFDTFSKDFIGSTSGNLGHFGKGFYFTDTHSKAKAFSEFYGGTGEVIAVKLDMNNIFYANEENISKIGEKHNLNLPNKIAVAIELKDLLKQLQKIDTIAFNLLASIAKYKDYSRGWKEFLKKHPKTFEAENGFDLNKVSDWYEETQGERYGNGVNDFTIEELREIGIEPKLVYDYEENLRMDYLTNLGQDSEGWTNAIKSEGYDSIIAGDEIVVFEPEQIHVLR